MQDPPEFSAAFDRARSLHARGSLQEAEHAYQELATRGEHREAVLRALVELYIEWRRRDDAIATLAALTEEVPDQLYYYGLLANMLDRAGQTEAAIGQYERLLRRQPEMAAAHYNVALLYKKARRYDEALDAYGEAVRLGLDRVEEAWSNMGVLYSERRQADKAAEMYDRALEANPGYVPALFNRGGLHEERGDKGKAIELYRQILEIDPGYSGALARLVHADRVTSEDDPLLDSVRRALEAAGDDTEAREELYFALGKALDDLGKYDEAFAAYGRANELGRRRSPAYDPAATRAAFDRLVDTFDRDWVRSCSTDASEAPIFICGMFRSGSTLLEQMLAGHPAITAGGELDHLTWLVGRHLSPYPERAAAATADTLRPLADSYVSHLQSLFPGSENVTDKRPDNFLYLGVVKAMFPSARIVYTRRASIDNCLSIWFQQLGNGLSYATSLEHTAHYYRQHERLMQHWQDCFGENIFTVEYDELVRDPERILRALLKFLGLEWDARCLDFRNADAAVKTASVWQVREAMHTRSSGRWRNYERFLGDVRALLE